MRSSDPAVAKAHLSTSSFTLDSSGVAGFFGGDAAGAAMATVHLFNFRRWGGWYNNPGAYEIVKQYGQLANSRLWDGLFPGRNRDPAELFGLDGQPGPEFYGACSGSSIPRTGHLAYLIARCTGNLKGTRIDGRQTTPADVTVIDLPYVPPETLRPPKLRSRYGLLVAIPISASVATCVMCALMGDWWCFASILLGILASGIACLVIGSGTLTFNHPKPAKGAPHGHGVLVEDNRVIVLRGEEAAVNSLTRGRFMLEYGGQPRYSAVGHCSVLLTAQFLVQLLLIPQGQLFGQSMFVTSLAVSWIYNTCLSSLDKDDCQTKVLLGILRLEDINMRKFETGSRTAMVVFSCLSLQSNNRINNPRKLLDKLLPNDTEVWERWKVLMTDKLSTKADICFAEEDWEVQGLNQEEKELLKSLLMDAQEAYEGWRDAYRERVQTATTTDAPLMAKTTDRPNPFSLSDSIRACVGTEDHGELEDRPLRVLASTSSGSSYELVSYTGQPFVAISYCWPNSDFQRIGVSNDPSQLTTPDGVIHSQHFSRFMVQAIETHRASIGVCADVWIDAHCINQRDEREKMAQVAILHRIYSRALTTLVMLEDIALNADEQHTLTRFRISQEAVALARRVMSARWFSRAWCSQELVLSVRTVFFIHDASNPEGAILVPSETLWHLMDAARHYDRSIPLFNVPRGGISSTLSLFSKTTSYALNIVQQLGCSDEYDKISLVCNLVRYTYRFADRPSAFGAIDEAQSIVRLNVFKMANVMAIERRDYSMLLANHGFGNPLQGQPGFGWAGVPVPGDRISEMWAAKDYEVGNDRNILVNDTGLVVRGIVAQILQEHAWVVTRDAAGLHVSVDSQTWSVSPIPMVHSFWSSSRDAQALHDLLIALASAVAHAVSDTGLHARVAIAYLLSEPDYRYQPEPTSGDLRVLLQELLRGPVGWLRDIAAAMKFVWRDAGCASFSTVLLSEDSILVVSGNATDLADGLSGRTLFQPFVARPKLFSAPMVLTANSMVLESSPQPDGSRRCVGCVRGLGMISEAHAGAEVQLQIT